MREVSRRQWDYILEKNDDNDEMVISVVCGSILVYSQKILLSEIERKKIEEYGESFLDELANDIRNNPDKYKDRKIR